MKLRKKRSLRWGEGAAVFCALALVSALFLVKWIDRLADVDIAAPVCSYFSEDDYGKYDLNRISAEELAGLPGIGDVIAGRIVAYRQTKGGFVHVEELDLIEGIGEEKMEMLRPRLKIG